jgi:hypothetical protein
MTLSADLVEDFGDIVDRREYLTDDPTFGFPVLSPFSVLSDRQEEKLWPVYRCEQDLARIRGRAHNLVIEAARDAHVARLKKLAGAIPQARTSGEESVSSLPRDEAGNKKRTPPHGTIHTNTG